MCKFFGYFAHSFANFVPLSVRICVDLKSCTVRCIPPVPPPTMLPATRPKELPIAAPSGIESLKCRTPKAHFKLGYKMLEMLDVLNVCSCISFFLYLFINKPQNILKHYHSPKGDNYTICNAPITTNPVSLILIPSFLGIILLTLIL